jgi:hypothetical protein
LYDAINANINISIFSLSIMDQLPLNRGALQNAQTPIIAIFEKPTLFCPNCRNRRSDWRHIPKGGSASLASLACMATTTKAVKRAVRTRVGKQLESKYGRWNKKRPISQIWLSIEARISGSSFKQENLASLPS